LSVSKDSLTTCQDLRPGQSLPLVIRPAVERLNLVAWAEENRDVIDEKLRLHGGLLFRGFGIAAAEELERFIASSSGAPLEYTERSSPRSTVSGRIYTSTDYPERETIFLHNEQSYNINFPLKIYFLCATPAERGGETPIADCRRVLARIDPRIRERFAAQGYAYVRNFGAGLGLSWQDAFQTEDRQAVERYCQKSDIDLEWRSGQRLRTRQVRPAIVRHPRTGEEVWFNHATFFHVSTLAPAIREGLLAGVPEEDLPNNTYYGDGKPIEPEVMEALRGAYRAETMTFTWERGDVLMLDNMMVAHGRAPFTGPRKVVVGMAEPCSHHDLRPMAEGNPV
jgi:alpha-ketoglutarate-dependent taurine dioxygenase